MLVPIISVKTLDSEALLSPLLGLLLDSPENFSAVDDDAIDRSVSALRDISDNWSYISQHRRNVMRQ